MTDNRCQGDTNRQSLPEAMVGSRLGHCSPEKVGSKRGRSLRKGGIQSQASIGLLSWWEVGCWWLTETGSSEEGRSTRGDYLWKVKAASSEEGRSIQGDCLWKVKAASSEEGRLIQGDCLSKVKAKLLSAKASESMGGNREAQSQEDSPEKSYPQGPMMTALALEYLMVLALECLTASVPECLTASAPEYLTASALEHLKALALEYLKARGRRKRVVPFQRVTVQALTKYPD